ncbi:hypothetical protein [Paenibacillus sp. MER TA 81-3]|nr:hypothetical protein [Paenibacillus sp. MER TA 81-3]
MNNKIAATRETSLELLPDKGSASGLPFIFSPERAAYVRYLINF